MDPSSCRRAIRIHYGQLTTAEKKVADYILQHGDQVVHQSVTALAEKTGVARSAVIRCCKGLGFEGYAALKIALAGENARNRQLHFLPDVSPDDTVADILDKVFAANVKALHDTAAQIDRMALRRAVDILQQAHSIYIYGTGTSSALASDFQYRLMQLGLTAFGYTDAATMKISTLNIRSGDAAIGISHTGRTIATVDAMRMARDSGAATLCITSYEGSPITRVCDPVLVACSDEIHYPVEAVSARIAHISLLDAITVALSARNYAAAQERYDQSHRLIDTIRYKEGQK